VRSIAHSSALERRPGVLSLVAISLSALALGAVLGIASADDTAYWLKMAEQYRAHAAENRRRASQWDELARKARARAVHATGAVKQTWEQNARNDEDAARELRSEADLLEQKAAQAEASAHGEHASDAGAATPGPPPSVASQPSPGSAGVNVGNAAPLPPPKNHLEADATPSTPAAPASCGCKPLPWWPKDKASPRAAARSEVSNDYLLNMFSDREGLYDGDVRKGLLALAHDIDPDGQLGISRGPAPQPTNPDFRVREGLVSDELINGPPAPGQKRYNIVNGRELALQLVHTLARTRRYGEPSAGLRRRCLLIGHFIGDDLFRIPNEAVARDAKGGFIGAFAQEFRRTVLMYAGFGSPGRHVAWGRNIPGEFKNPKEPMYLDEYDLSDAALDIILFHDDATGRDFGWFSRKSQYEGEADSELARELVLTAAGKPQFQATGAGVDPRQASVACKAFDTLVVLSRPKDADKLRYQVRQQFYSAMQAPNDLIPSVNPVALAARAVLLSAPPGSDAEARELGNDLLESAEHYFGFCTQPDSSHVRRAEVETDLLLALQQPAPDSQFGPVISQLVQKKLAERKRAIDAENKNPIGYFNAKCLQLFVDRLSGSPSEVAARVLNLCSPPTCNITLADLPNEQPKLDLKGAPAIMVVPKRYFPWPADSLDRAQPFYIEVTLNYEDAKKQGASLQVKLDVEGTRRSKLIKLTGAPHRGATVYSTDAPILFERPFEVAGPSDLVKSPWDSETLESLKLKNGDIVDVSYRGATTSFKFFDSWVQQKIAQNEDAFVDLQAVYELQLATGSGAAKEARKRLKMIANARTIINDYHPAAADDQLTDLDRAYIGDHYLALIRHGPPGENDHDEQARRNWMIGPTYSKRFGIEFVNAAEQDAVAQGIIDRKNRLRESIVQVPLAFALASYHMVTQLSGAGQMWTVVYGTDEDGNPVDLTGRIFAGVGLASNALFSVASSKYLTDLSPSARAHVKPQRPGEPADEPTEADYQLNPDTQRSIKDFVEGPANRGASPEPEADIKLIRKAYGPNAVFRTPDPTLPAVLQIGNTNCLIEVARAHILAGTGRKVPEAVLREAAALQGYARPGQGTVIDGYVALINQAGGKAATLHGGIKALEQLIDAGYYVMLVVKLKTGGHHAVDFRGFTVRAGVEHAVFADPYFGKEVMVPVCDMPAIFDADAKLGWGEIAVADFGQAKPIH